MTILRYLPRFRRAYRELQAFEDRENWSRAEIEAYQLERINEVWRQAVSHVPYYGQLQQQQRLPLQFGRLSEFCATVPVLTKQQVRDNPEAFLSKRAAAGAWHRTSGSTGTPMRVFRSRESHLEMLRARYRQFAAWGVDIFDRTAWLWGCRGVGQPGLSGHRARLQERVEDRLRNRLRLSAARLGPDDLRRHLQQLAGFRPAALYGLSRAVYLLALEANEMGFSCDGLKLVNLTGEAAYPYMVAAIERAFRAPAIMEYGSVECGYMAGASPDSLDRDSNGHAGVCGDTEGRSSPSDRFDTPAGLRSFPGTRALRVREDIVLLETVRREDGPFDIIVTILNNPSFPLLRYQIGDVVPGPLEFPERGFAVLPPVAGRDDDLLVTRTGRPLHAVTIDEIFEQQFGAAVRRYRVHQHADGRLNVAVELKAACRRFQATELQQRLSAAVDGFPVALEIVNAIPQTTAGKHRLVTSELDPLGAAEAEPSLDATVSP
jgi:phenylacetate-CoA ligase